MLDFGIGIEIDAPPDLVWSVMRDIDRWPEWTPTVTSIRKLGKGPLVVGSRLVIKQPKLPPSVWKLTVMDDKARSFDWTTGFPGMLLTASHRVEPTDGRSRAHLSIRFSGVFGPLFARLTKGINDGYLALEANGLKERSESLRLQS